MGVRGHTQLKEKQQNKNTSLQDANVYNLKDTQTERQTAVISEITDNNKSVSVVDTDSGCSTDGRGRSEVISACIYSKYCAAVGSEGL